MENDKGSRKANKYLINGEEELKMKALKKHLPTKLEIQSLSLADAAGKGRSIPK